jgi:hypothetical protein
LWLKCGNCIAIILLLWTNTYFELLSFQLEFCAHLVETRIIIQNRRFIVHQTSLMYSYRRLRHKLIQWKINIIFIILISISTVKFILFQSAIYMCLHHLAYTLQIWNRLKITDPIIQDLFWEGDSCSAGLDILCFCGNWRLITVFIKIHN